MQIGSIDDGAHLDVKISRVRNHPDFDRQRMLNDISIVTLSEKVDINGATIRPVCLPRLKNRYLVNVCLN